jgi:hypothetical protein
MAGKVQAAVRDSSDGNSNVKPSRVVDGTFTDARLHSMISAPLVVAVCAGRRSGKMCCMR